MIIVRAPLRISLGGGGTDLPGWYQRHGGFFVSAAIDKYIYLTGADRLMDHKIWLSYSKTEVCDRVEEIEHTFLKACLGRYPIKGGLEIHSISEVPGNSGLGSSGAFLVGCLTLLDAMYKEEMTRKALAELACRIEMVDLGKSSGKQDQYISTFGGIAAFTVGTNGEVTVDSMDLPAGTVQDIESGLFLYYSGVSRNSETILSEQGKALRQATGDPVAAMHEIQKIGYLSRDALLAGDLDAFGELLHQHWLAKKKMATQMSDPALDRTYDFARELGATGGKLIGAGGGGYWMFHVPPEKRRAFRARIGEAGLKELPWRFDFHGCSVIYAQ